MSQEDEFEIKQPAQIWDKAVIGFAALLTLCGIGMFFFKFTVSAPVPDKPAADPTEVTIGIGKGQTIHPSGLQGDPAPAITTNPPPPHQP